MNVLKKTFTSLIISGAVILLIGLYYMIIKAGIPYQDPTVEMQIQYEINMGIGNVLSLTGFCMTLVAAIIRIVLGLVRKNKSK